MYGYVMSPHKAKDWIYSTLKDASPLPVRSQNAAPPLRAQGPHGTCVAFACTHIKDAQEAKDERVNVSPLELFQRCKETDGLPEAAGTTLVAALDILRKEGVCKESTFPYSLIDTGVRYTPAMLTEAAKYKIEAYARCYTLEDIKQALFHEGPILIGVTVSEGFRNHTGKWMKAVFGGQLLGGHGLVVLNYDDTAVNPLTGEVGAVELINSWGPTWGENGRAWISYSQLMLRTDIGMPWMLEAFTLVDIRTANYLPKTTLELVIGNANALVNGAPVRLDAPAVIMNNRTMVPLRFISEALGATVTWDGTQNKITITEG